MKLERRQTLGGYAISNVTKPTGEIAAKMHRYQGSGRFNGGDRVWCSGVRRGKSRKAKITQA